MYWISIITLAFASLAASVKGSGTVTFGSSVEHISVNVSGTSGRASFEDKAAGGNFNGQIDINCVSVVGNTATLSGIVSHSNNKSLIGKEGDLPREVELLDCRQRERLGRVGLDRAFVGFGGDGDGKRSAKDKGEQRTTKHGIFP